MLLIQFVSVSVGHQVCSPTSEYFVSIDRWRSLTRLKDPRLQIDVTAVIRIGRGGHRHASRVRMVSFLIYTTHSAKATSQVIESEDRVGQDTLHVMTGEDWENIKLVQSGRLRQK